MLVTVIALNVRQTLDVGEPTARACLAELLGDIADRGASSSAAGTNAPLLDKTAALDVGEAVVSAIVL